MLYQKIKHREIMERNINDQLIRWKNDKARKPLILRGTRQVGKTYSLEAFGKKNFQVCHYLNFEEDEQLAAIFKQDLKPDHILRELEFYLDRPIAVNEDILIFDEVQACPRALNSLKYFQEQKANLAIAAAGSLLGVELSEVSFPVGKVEFLDMHPLSFGEFLGAVGDHSSSVFFKEFKGDQGIPEIIHNRLWQQMIYYMIIGGLPEVVKAWRDNLNSPLAAFKAVRKVQKNLLISYLADMAKHSGKQKSMHLERLWSNIPNQLAREQDGSAPKFKFKNVIPGVRGYERLAGPIDWLTKAGLIRKVTMVNNGNLPLSAYAKDNIFKLYCFDTGLLGALGNLPPKTILDYDYGSYKGYFAENFAVQEFQSTDNQPLYYWRERTAEVEFVREFEGDIIPIEIKSGWVTQAKSLKVFAEKYNPPYRIILSGRPFKIDHKHRVRFYPLYLAGKIPLKQIS